MATHSLGTTTGRPNGLTSELFEPDLLLPSQWFGLLRSARLSPEKRLMLAVLEDAVTTFQKTAHVDTPSAKKLFQDVDVWIRDEEEEYVFAFVTVCEALGLDPSAVRSALYRWRDQRPVTPAAQKLAACRRLVATLRGYGFSYVAIAGALQVEKGTPASWMRGDHEPPDERLAELGALVERVQTSRKHMGAHACLRTLEIAGWTRVRIGQAVGVSDVLVGMWTRGELTPRPQHVERLRELAQGVLAARNAETAA